MKAKTLAISTIVLIVLIVAGATMAWFTTDANASNKFKMGTVDVIVVEEDFPDGGYSEVTTGVTYTKNVQVQSIGTKKTYVRVRLVPEWSDPSLPVSNAILNLADNEDWILHTDGYYYFKYYLTTNQLTSKLLEKVTFTELGSEYNGKIFTLKVVAEGVQITHEAWKVVWGLNELPFTPNVLWQGEQP